ncbi:hypothetical protein GCM10010249_13560 [Streptomyces roseolilacinus]|uniref:Uncharacterized protein n=1 Tax=Streptomyces roseolilacinus TaxID=66904 RepID=A0A918AXB7_9ACTN|nr:hypothetical protein GCM10010249_13560 [Streptomyces roseolilacinus]
MGRPPRTTAGGRGGGWGKAGGTGAVYGVSGGGRPEGSGLVGGGLRGTRTDGRAGVVVRVRRAGGRGGRPAGHTGLPASTGISDSRHSSMPSFRRIARRPRSASSRTAS